MAEVKPQSAELFKKLEAKIPSTTIGAETWYLIALTALTGGPAPYPELAAELYLYLIAKPEFQTPESRQALIRRIRETLVKCVSIIGVCKPLEAIFSITRIEREADKDYSCSRENWKCDEDNYKRGMAWLEKLYLENVTDATDLFNSQRDFDWISKNITYGLYLSDRQVLNDVETELIVLTGIMIQNLKLETHWHLRGTRRIGVSAEDVETIQQSVELVAEFMGISLDRVPRVKDIESEV